jgi:hypothetical protein
MAGRTAGFAHARGAGDWLSASPRVQRLVAANVAVILGAALAAVAVHQGPGVNAEPLALAAATGPVSAPVSANADVAPVRTRARANVSHSTTKRRPKQAPATAPRGWEYWSMRIRGCESHGRPDAQPDYKAKNPDSSASGAYQITDTTWGGRFGVSHASDATPAQQDAVASELYRRHGTADWLASAPCWREPSRH